MRDSSLHEIGRYIYTDCNGFLSSNLSIEQVQDDWKLPAKEFVDSIRVDFFDNIYSIFLRGSVATGSAIKHISDIDFFLIYKIPFTKSEKEKIHLQTKMLNSKYPFITRFDIGYFSCEEIINIKEKALIKLTAICIFGKDLKKDIPELKPGRDTAVTLLGLREELELTLHQIDTGFYNSGNTSAMCVWMMKRLIRGGFELTAERSQKYSRDLYLCWKNFSLYYPEKSTIFYEALNLAVNPSRDIFCIKKVIIECGHWLIVEAHNIGLI